MSLSGYIETLNALGDENRVRLCALLRERELCVTDLVRVTGISQSRVSTHLGRLRDAGLVRDRRQGAQSFYGLATEALTGTAQVLLDEAAKAADPTLQGDKLRLSQLDAERRDGLPESVADEMERDYSPGRTWQSLAAGIAGLLRLGDVLDVGSGDGAAAAVLAPRCASLVCIDTSPRLIETARERLAAYPHARAEVADVHALPFGAASFDAVLVFHTLTYAEHPARALQECARVLRPGGRLVLLCLDRHAQQELTARYGERHPGFSPREVRGLLVRARLEVAACEIACREARKPHLQVVLALADKPELSASTSTTAASPRKPERKPPPAKPVRQKPVRQEPVRENQ
jgi:SAM-dependent methyltransferase